MPARGFGSRGRVGRARRGAGRVVRLLAAGVSVALVLTLAEVPVWPAASAAPVAAVGEAVAPGCPDERADRVSATVTARLCNKRVEVAGERSETTQVWVGPDGSMSAQVFAGPVRFRGPDGGWVPVDVTLQALPDGSVAARGHPRGLRLAGASGDGVHDLVVLQGGGQQVALGWRGVLPQPVLAGDRATYVEAWPGVDVVVAATRTGFEQFLVVKTRSALDKLGTVALPWRMAGLSAGANTVGGGLVLRDGSGADVARVPAASMWDARVDPASGDRLRRAAVGMGLAAGPAGGTDLVLTPDPGFVADAELVFPVTIDPGGNFGVGYDAFVQTDYTTNQEAATDLKLGTYNGGGVKARSLFRFDASPFYGATIGSATFNLWESHSFSCRASGWELWKTGWPDYATVWANQPAWLTRYGTSSATRGYSSSCADGWVSIPATGWLQEFADSRYPYSAFGLRAANESDSDSWKQFNSAEAAANIPYMAVSWNAAPVIGARSTAPTTACVTGSGRPYMPSLTPRLSAAVSESRGEASDLRFEWWPTGGSGPVGSGTAVGVPSGSTGSVDVPGGGGGALAEGGTYSWRVKAHDTGGQDSLWSSWCEFTVDSVPPGVPVVSSTAYPNDGGWHGQYGQAGAFTFTPAGATTDLAGFVYQLDTAAAPSTISATGPVTVSITPPEDGTRTLSVWAKDRAGNLSDAYRYVFKVGRAGLVSPTAGANVVARMKLAIENDPAFTRVRFVYRRGPGAVEYTLPWSNVTTAAGTPVPGGPSASTPVRLSDLDGYAVWNAVDTLGPTGGVVQVRAYLFPDSDTEPGYLTQWVTVTIDANGDGAAATEAGPGSLNLLTGDYSLSATDADELGLSVSRTASSREPAGGWMPQGERLTVNQQQVGTDLSGFATPCSPNPLSRAAGFGQGGTTDSLKITATSCGSNTYAALGGYTGLTLGMQPGKRYRVTAWIYVPGATGLNPGWYGWGQSILAETVTGGVTQRFYSAHAAWVDGWQQLSVDLSVPAGASGAYVKLFNGGAVGSVVYWDNMSVREIVAPFGPQWSGGPSDATTGNEFSSLQFPTPDLARLNLAGGGWLTFGRSTTGAFFPQPGAESLTLSAVDASTYRLADLDGTISQFTKPAGSAAFLLTATWSADADSSTRYLYDLSDNRTLVKKVVNPVEPGVGDCTTAVPARGCEVLEYVYATATTATPTVFGDITDQVQQVKVWTWEPVAAAQTAVVLAEYRYDDAGRLREVWDPRISPPSKTQYEYDTAGRVTRITRAGQLPWMFDYGTIGSDPNPGWLHRVRRAALAQGSPTTLDGELTTRVVYQVPLTRATGGPHDLDAASAQSWAQKDVATDATALFPPEQDPLVQQATPTTPGPDGYRLATIYYLNASAQEVNTATPGGYVDTQQYDSSGNVVWTLEATNRMIALGTHPDAAGYAAQLNLPAASNERAELLAATKRYSGDGVDLLETTGPRTRTVLERDLVDPNGQLSTIPAGSQILARPHTTYGYDEGKPDGAAYHLLTTETSGATVDGWPVDADPRVEQRGYDPFIGGTSGWTLKKPTKTVTDAGTGGAQVTSYVAYDAAGRTTQTRGVAATGTDARTTLSVYYTAATNPADAACGNRPEWAGQLCVSKPAGAVTGHDPTRMPGELPIKRITRYSRWAQPEIVTETAAGATRTTTTTYDAADRIHSVQIASDDGSAPLPEVVTSYDPASGQVTATTMGSAAITRQYDLLARLYRYTDADSGITTTEFDHWGQPAKVSDNTGYATLTYDRSIDPRGLLTSLTDSIAGTFTARYSPDGQLVELHYPGGLTRRDTLDPAFTPIARTYTRDFDATTVYAESVVENSAGQWISHSYTGGSKTYGYDRLGRLTSTAQVDALDQCTTRGYTHTPDNRTNRATKQTWQPGIDGTCRTGGTPDTQHTYTYDSADRLADPGYTYDPFGRTTTTPDGLNIGYYVNDLAATQQQGDARQTWTLDPKHRFRADTTDTNLGGTWTTTAARLNHYGDDTDKPRWTIEDTVTGALTRNVSGPDGDLAATTTATGDARLQLTNLHGDIAATIDPTLTAPEVYTYDEFGLPAYGQTNVRYGWLGSKQRSNDTLAGLILMGVRLYNPALGRFLQTDPVAGGSCNDYDYTCADPVNSTDLDGRRRCRRFCWPDWRAPLRRVLRPVDTALRGAWNWGVRTYTRIFWRPLMWFAVRLYYGNNCGTHFSNARMGGFWAYGIGFAVGFIRGRPCL
jgi:RHS repeat-associated protein